METLQPTRLPAFQLAVRIVADALEPMDAEFPGSDRIKQFLRARVAAQAVQECLPIECSRLQYRWEQGVEVTHTEVMVARSLPRTNWLAKAQVVLDANDGSGEGAMAGPHLLAARNSFHELAERPGV